MGNVQPVSLGQADASGFYTGRVYLESPEKYLTDQGIGRLIRAGWELAFHGIDHTPQTSIIAQVDGPGKLARSYMTGKREIERLLRKFPSAHGQVQVRTNTLPLNGWDQNVRQVAVDYFDWTEIRWAGSLQHVPVIYGPGQDPHGSFRSIDFNRATFGGLKDLDTLVRLLLTDGGGWLIFQVHDVVDNLSDSPDPPTAMLTGEYLYLVERLKASGAQFVTFSEGARMIQRPHTGNRLRNTRFGLHSFLRPDEALVLDWFPSVQPADGAALKFFADGTVSLESPDSPAWLA
ncbi:MAG: hypothetical protein ACE5ID_11820, partial [Acidobacteriota bacterium]